MSSEGENEKNQAVEGEEKKVEKEEVDSAKTPAADMKSDECEEKPEVKEEAEKDKPEENDKKENNDASKTEENDEKPDGKKVEKEEDGCDEPTEESEKDEEEEEENEKNEDEEDGDSDEKETEKEKKKKNQKEEKEKEKEGTTEIPKGSGTQLGEIPRIDASISRFKNDDLKLLHKLLFKDPGKTAMIKKNIRKFNGYTFKKDSDEYKKKLTAIEKFEVKQLKIICEMLDLEKKGNKEEVSERILEFLIEPKDSGKGAGGGRPKRTAAVRANNRGYSSHDESYSSDEKSTPRARRNMGKRANLKDETSSESDFQPSDNSEDEKPSVKKRKRVGRKKKNDSEEEVSEVDSDDTDDSDGPKNKKKKAAAANSKVAKGRGAGRGRGRRAAATPAAKKRGAPKRGRKRAQESSDEEEEEGSAEGDGREEEGSSSEDEPLVKKTAKAPQPPTDEEIKTYVKEILEGANLEEITMKTVCKQVYAHYPNFDLTHKKDYIKTTVKSLITT